MTSNDQARQAFLLSLAGCKLTSLKRHEFSWSLHFENVATLVIEGSWRILSAGRVSLSSLDDAQKFGLPDPVDAEMRARHLILSKAVNHAAIRADTGDLTISFGEDLVLEALNMSSGYEAW